MKIKTAEYWIEKLDLEPHPEGGFYKEMYRSSEKIIHQHLPVRFGGDRNFCTSIYFLLRSEDRSLLHRIKSDELWHFYAGSAVTIFGLTSTQLKMYRLGGSPEGDESLQVAVPANTWFGAMVREPDSYALVGCTVAPGFDFQDFEMGKRADLLQEFPAHQSIIELLTKEEA